MTCVCGHPADAHDAGDCWWDLDANVESSDPTRQCPCVWFEEAS